MNYLAHIYLSGTNTDVQLGNFIADFIRGNHYKNLPLDVQKGIKLHRFIDNYTDHHPIFKKSKKRLFNEFRHYSAVVVDMFYDHFLAKNFHKYSAITLYEFSQAFYLILEANSSILPKAVVNLIPVIKEFNWLYSYREIAQLKAILNQMNNRTKHVTELHKSVDTLTTYYSEFESEFFEFFDELQKAVVTKKAELGIG
jgi:acyl carrier protein phosphodiesterase